MKSRIELFNTSFFLHSDETNEHIQSLIGYIRGKLDIIQNDVEVDDQLKLATLALLLITHELHTTKSEIESQNDFFLHSIQSMLMLLDEEKKINTG